MNIIHLNCIFSCIYINVNLTPTPLVIFGNTSVASKMTALSITTGIFKECMLPRVPQLQTLDTNELNAQLTPILCGWVQQCVKVKRLENSPLPITTIKYNWS